MFSRVHLMAFAVFALVVPALALAAAPSNEPTALAVFGVIAASLALTLTALQRTPLSLAVAHTGPPSAQRRRRGSFLRQSNPDTAGRPRPRAPGSAAA